MVSHQDLPVAVFACGALYPLLEMGLLADLELVGLSSAPSFPWSRCRLKTFWKENCLLAECC